MARGGRRKGTPGKRYPNRSDLTRDTQPVQAATGQPYGQRGTQENAQRAMPLPNAQPLVSLDAPTARPDEPLTAGLATGPGPGPEALGMPPMEDTEPADELRALYERFPSDDLRRLIEDL